MSFWGGLRKELAERLTGQRVQDAKDSGFKDVTDSNFSIEASVSDTLANLVCGGFDLTISGENERAKTISEVAEDFSQQTLVNAISLGFESGDALVVPMWTGNMFINTIIGRRDFKILSSQNGVLQAVAYIVDEKVLDRDVYRLIQVMSLEDYTANDESEKRGCHYTLHKIKNDRVTKEAIQEWDSFESDWWVADVDRLLLGRFKCPQKDKLHPNSVYGVPLCHNAAQPIREIHYLYEQLHNEFELSEKAVIASKTMFTKDADGHLNLPRGRDRLFMATRGGSVDDNKITEWAPSIQVQPYIEALEVQKRQVEKLIGVDDGILSNPNTQSYANVDHVRKSMRNTQAFIDRARGVADQMIDDLLYSWDMLLNHYGKPTGDYSRDRDWSDEYIESFADKRDALIAGYGIGATDALDFREFVLDEAPEVAQQRVAEIAAQRQVSIFAEE